MLHDVVSVLGALEVVWSALGAKTGMGYYWDFGVLSGRRGGGAFVRTRRSLKPPVSVSSLKQLKKPVPKLA